MMDDIWGDMDEAAGGGGFRNLSFSGKSGDYTAGKDDDGRKRFQAILLYTTPDHGRSLWPDGKAFVGDKALCQSERSQPPYDKAHFTASGSDAHTMRQMGWTGNCSTCQIPMQVCKPQRLLYILDLHHLKETGEPQITKLWGKGAQNTWNSKACLAKLMTKARKEGKEPTQFVVEFASEPGEMGSKKMKFEFVGIASEEQHAIANTLAREAYETANRRREQHSIAPSAPAAALPAAREEVVEVVDAEDLF